MTVEVHLLDVGHERYGDALLYTVGARAVLVDGGHPGDWDGSVGHPSIPNQLSELLGGPTPTVDLLVVSHAHRDHIGCLPRLVDSGLLTARWAYLPDPRLAWPDVALDPVLAGLREEDLGPLGDDDLGLALAEAAALRPSYEAMISALGAAGCELVYHGDDVGRLLDAFADLHLAVIGPSREQLELAHAALTDAAVQVAAAINTAFAAETRNPVAMYRGVIGLENFGLLEAIKRSGAAVNAQSAVLTFGPAGRKILLGGDLQFADPEIHRLGELVEQLWAATIAAGPYAFAKLSHHGSPNANPHGFPSDLRCTTFGVCAGSGSDRHPSSEVLQQLFDAGAVWVRTDRNGRCSVRLGDNGAETMVTRGSPNDRTTGRVP